MINYWLMKSEPECVFIDDFWNDLKHAPWDGVRNLPSSHFHEQPWMKGDYGIFLSLELLSCWLLSGTGQGCKKAYPDHTSWDINSHYLTQNQPRISPRWFMVDVVFVERWPIHSHASRVKETSPELADYVINEKGSRLLPLCLLRKRMGEYITVKYWKNNCLLCLLIHGQITEDCNGKNLALKQNDAILSQ